LYVITYTVRRDQSRHELIRRSSSSSVPSEPLLPAPLPVSPSTVLSSCGDSSWVSVSVVTTLFPPSSPLNSPLVVSEAE
jgi:hypothetical protein